MRASRLARQIQLQTPSHVRLSSTAERPKYDPVAILSQPTWSVRSLLPQDGQQQQQQEDASIPHIPPSQLAHLLRLSALPSPSSSPLPSPPSQEAEAKAAAQEAQDPQAPSPILATLHAQLHFLHTLQSIPLNNPTTVLPLDAIRDETPAGRHESAITLTHPSIQAALANEEVYGRCRRPRRRGSSSSPEEGVEDWDVLGNAGETVGGYFVVRSGGEGNIEGG
ncbi:uncharacterized protein C8A04DRAFT_14215 [Dichotomopilus funicola]|uniref:Uncharacterized protein n=1 Tax=Dichotomopilus funicola TaxID=1934379 RepID=A0AAN6UXZ8_9PEZI|nr:hypothetical protein C8A04DRAFT_14215 [Dichotomopilus funicola]